MRRWTINGRFLTQPLTGVQRAGIEICRALDGLADSGSAGIRGLDIDVVVPPSEAVLPVFRALRLRQAGRFGGHAWEQSVLPRETPGGLLSLCNTGPLLHRRHIVCMHDANTKVCPESYSPVFRAFYGALLPALGRTAAAVTTVSDFSADELARHGIRRRGRISVVPNGHEHTRSWVPRHSEATRRIAGRNTIMVIGSPVPHKNVSLILGLSERLAEQGLRVAVVGGADPRVYRAEARSSDRVDWVGRLSDDELAAILADCLCLAFPSFNEGFGMPALEAMALGCPVVASNRASIPEVCGDAVLYAPPDAPDLWLNHFLALRESEDLRAVLVVRGRARAARFKWLAAAEAYLALMTAVGERQPRAPPDLAGC